MVSSLAFDARVLLYWHICVTKLSFRSARPLALHLRHRRLHLLRLPRPERGVGLRQIHLVSTHYSRSLVQVVLAQYTRRMSARNFECWYIDPGDLLQNT